MAWKTVTGCTQRAYRSLCLAEFNMAQCYIESADIKNYCINGQYAWALGKV